MKRLEFKWTGKYYDVCDAGVKIGEIYYVPSRRQFQYHSELDTIYDRNYLKQIYDFLGSENQSTMSYA